MITKRKFYLLPNFPKGLISKYSDSENITFFKVGHFSQINEKLLQNLINKNPKFQQNTINNDLADIINLTE